MAIQRFYLLSPESISHLYDQIRRILCDRDPSVMGATLCLLKDLVRVCTFNFFSLLSNYARISHLPENRC